LRQEDIQHEGKGIINCVGVLSKAIEDAANGMGIEEGHGRAQNGAKKLIV